MTVSYLPDPTHHQLWSGIEALLKPAADYGGIPVLSDGDLVWIAYEGDTVFGAGTTLLWDDGDAEILLCGGSRHREWVAQAEAAVSAWARDCGAKRLTMRGRKGWARYFRAFGWVASPADDGKTLYEKEL